MDRYKSWSGLAKQLQKYLCEELCDKISYFLTRYHTVHDSYGRAAIRLDGRELVCFSWAEMYHQEAAISELHASDSTLSYKDTKAQLKESWDESCTYCESDFLGAVLQFRNMNIQTALESDNYIIKILAILDRRVGKRTLAQIAEAQTYKTYPTWVRQFYELRLSSLE